MSSPSSDTHRACQSQHRLGTLDTWEFGVSQSAFLAMTAWNATYATFRLLARQKVESRANKVWRYLPQLDTRGGGLDFWLSSKIGDGSTRFKNAAVSVGTTAEFVDRVLSSLSASSLTV